MSTTDKRPWFCTSCGDRFAKDQTIRTTNGHQTVYRPREEQADA